MQLDNLVNVWFFILKKAHSKINIEIGKDITINDLAIKIIEEVGYKDGVKYESNQLDGTPQKARYFTN